MKKVFLTFVASLALSAGFAQNASVKWGEEFKMQKGSTDLSVIFADASGVYVKESHMALKSYFVVGATMRESAALIKLNKDLSEEYRQDFNKELKGKDFERFFFLKDKLFLLATEYNRKEKKLTLFAVQVDKKSGELSGEWKEFTSWSKDDKKDDINFNVTYNSDSTKMVIVSSIEGKEKNNYEVRQFDNTLKQVAKPIAMTNGFEPKTFQLEDVLYTSNGNVVLVGRVYEYQEGKKKKTKYLDFLKYNIRIHNEKGELVKEINTEISGRWLISTKVVQIPNKELVIAAFYSNEKKGKEINGILVQRINPVSGEVVSTSTKEINTKLITKLDETPDEANDDESRSERKEREKLEKIQNEEDGFSKFMIFRNFIYTPDNGLVILAEKYHHYTYVTTNYSAGAGGMGRTTTTTYHVYECGDLMMTKMDVSGNITWFHVLPKEQREVIQSGSANGFGGGLGFTAGSNFFNPSEFNMPFYAGFGVLSGNNNASIIFNDHKKNVNTLELGQKVKKMSYFRKSECFSVDLDLTTGNYKRNILFSNDEVPTAMPRLASGIGKDLFIIGKEDRFLGRSKIAIAKVTLK